MLLTLTRLIEHNLEISEDEFSRAKLAAAEEIKAIKHEDT
jgi:hypothetical protein